MKPDKLTEWLEAKALHLVGTAAVYTAYNKWKELEAEIIKALREAYELNH